MRSCRCICRHAERLGLLHARRRRSLARSGGSPARRVFGERGCGVAKLFLRPSQSFTRLWALFRSKPQSGDGFRGNLALRDQRQPQGVTSVHIGRRKSQSSSRICESKALWRAGRESRICHASVPASPMVLLPICIRRPSSLSRHRRSALHRSEW